MAAPTYATDLTLIHACDAASASWTEPTGFTDGAITLPETDYFIQNTGCLSKNMGTGTSATSGAIYDSGAGQTINSPNVVVMWLYFGAPNALATRANGGIRVFRGSGTGAFYHYYVLGNDNYTYGGWKCIPVDPNLTADNTTGSPTTTKQFFGAAAVLGGVSSVSKGNPFGIDIVRHGRMESRFSNGDSGAGGPATFAGFVASNDALAARWGQIQAIDGGYLWQGLITLGYGGTAVYFVDSNRNILVANTIKVQSAFNRIEIRVATSTVSWTGITIQALGTTSKGEFEVIDNATVSITNCTFIDMSTFVFKSGATQTVDATTFRRCGQVTQNGADFDNCKFEDSTGTAALVVDDITKVTNCSFDSAGTGYGIQGFSSAGDYNLASLSFTGYAANDGSTGNEAIYVTATTGVVNLTVTGTPSVRTAGATVNKISGTVDTVITVKDTATPPVAIESARVLVWVTGNENYFYQKTGLTFAGSGTTVTVTGHTAHGMGTGDKILVEGVVNDDVYNGVFTITYVSTSSYTYTTSATITNATPTGTIKVTYVVIDAATNASGQVTRTKAWTVDQPIAGRIRKSSAAPYYQPSSFIGTIDTTGGFSTTIQLIGDE
jgi:hypothetical protein